MKKLFYLLCLMLFSLFIGIFAQSPGGVHGTEAWFMTESVTDSLNGQYRWADYSGDSVKLFVKTDSLLSEFKQSRSDLRTFNFNPTIKVTHNDLFKQFYVNNTDLSQYTFIGVYAPYSMNNSGIVYSVNSATGTVSTVSGESIALNDSLISYDNNVVGNLNLSDEQQTERFEGALKILSHYHAEMPNKTLWGNSKSATISIGEKIVYSNEEETSLTSSNSYQGYFPELAVFSRNLTPFERNRVESYLAMKYGISLPHSYYRSDSTLIWNIADNPNYNNRITSTICDNSSNLYQPISTTSYEEAPYYSWIDNDTLDSYFLNNSASAPSKNRLLVQGKEFANRIENGKYYIWGDNDQSTELDDSTLMMTRNWLIQTNIPDTKPEEIQNIWTGNGISVYNRDFKNYLTQDSEETVTAVTNQLINGEGAISFTFRRLKGIFDVGFVSDKSYTQCNFGYRFTPYGTIYLIINGNISRTIHATSLSDSIPVKILKTDKNLILQIDGVCRNTVNIGDPANDYYGFVSMQYSSSLGLFSIDDIRVDGVYDNGNQIELGYIDSGNKFYDNKDNTYLIIDRSASGEFLEEDLEYHKVSSYTQTREKLLFNNVYWDTDGNGADIFSFGCVDCLHADITTTDATMGDSISNYDGAINIKIKAGMPAYYFVLNRINDTDTTLIDQMHFSEDIFTLSNLQSGLYKLELGQMGGFDVYGTASLNSHKRIARSNISVSSGELSWIVPENVETGVFDVGLGANQDVTYGFRMHDGILYFVSPDEYIEFGSIYPGTLLSIIYAGNFVTFSIESQQIRRVYGVSGSLYGIVEAIHGDCQVMNFRITGMTSMNTTAGMYADYYEPCGITKYVEIQNSDETATAFSLLSRSNISTKSRTSTTDIEQVNSELSEFAVYSKNNNSEFTAVLNLETLIPASLVVFDASGKFVLSREFSGVSNTRELSFSVPAPGVYIVKAITDIREFTQKIISK